MVEKSAVVEHMWENHHPINWEKTSVLDRELHVLPEGGLAHLDDTCRGALQQGYRIGDPRLLVPLVMRQEGRAAGSH